MFKIAPGGAVLSFGEILLRIIPDADGQWLTNNQLPFFLGGAELNVATATALWGLPTKYFTAMPDNDLARQILIHLRNKGIDTATIHKSGDRLGLFYLTKGRDMRHDALIYDRAGSSFANLKPGTVDWDVVFKGVSWFHFSAICPALTQHTAQLCMEALQAASDRGIIISVDLNYRAKLWQYGKDPNDVMPHLVKYCNLIMGNIWAMETMLGIPVSPQIHHAGQKTVYLEEAQHTSQKIMMQFPTCEAVANTFRFGSGANINYYATLSVKGQFYHSAEYVSNNIVDKVGSGDCFMAGLIYGFYNKLNPAATLEFATAAAFNKFFIASDATTSTVADIKQTIIKWKVKKKSFKL